MNVFICLYKLPVNFLEGEISHNKVREMESVLGKNAYIYSLFTINK